MNSSGTDQRQTTSIKQDDINNLSIFVNMTNVMIFCDDSLGL